MSVELITILGLVVIFLIATVLPVHMGALAFVGAFVVGGVVLGETTDDVIAGFPGDLFVILVGVTYLFAIANHNGTVEWLVHMAVRAVGGRISLIPWVMFTVTGILTAFGAVVPAAVAIIAPIGMGFAAKYKINPMLMGLLIINGASAGGFSPISIFGSIVNGVVERNELPSNPTLLFLASVVFNVLLSVVVYFLFGGRELTGRNANEEMEQGILVADRNVNARNVQQTIGGTTLSQPGQPGQPGSGGVHVGPEDAPTLNLERALSLVGLVGLAVGALVFGLDVGFTAITVAVFLTLIKPGRSKAAVGEIAWPTVLLICGIVTYVSMMERAGAIDFLGNQVANIGAPLIAALIICFIGAAVSAFASTTGILGALIPLAVPFLLAGEVGAVGLIIALSISSSVVDSSPFSTSGALVVANSIEEKRDAVFKGLMRWGFSMVVIAPIVSWLIFVVPGLL